MRTDAHQLRNLRLSHKIVGTAALLGGLALFLVAWFAAMTLLRWTFTGRALLFEWGESLRTVGANQPRLYLILMGLSLVGQGIVFLSARRLFRRSALRHRIRTLLEWLGSLLFAMNILVWLALPYLGVARAIALPVTVLLQAALLVYVAVPLQQMWFYHRLRTGAGASQRIVVVGGGLAGLSAALELDRKVGHERDLELMLIDRNNYSLFPPLLPSAATGSIETRQVTYPFRRIFETTNIHFEKTDVTSIDPTRKLVHTSVGDVHYDYLLLCPGAESNTFRIPGVTEHAFFLRELKDAIALRNRIIDCFERAAAITDPSVQAELLRFLVVGAGPTGVEVATEIHDLAYKILLKRYPEIEPDRIDICLVQSGGRILPGWSDKVVSLAERQLASLRVRLLLDTRVTALTPDHALLTSGSRLPTRNCIWCAGVRASPLLERSGLSLDPSGRVPVEPDLRAEPSVFVLGDSACLMDNRTGKPLPQLGQVAFQQGPHTARNLIRLIEGRPTRPFRYFNFGSLVSVGEHHAAVDIMGIRLSGFVGWFVWRTLYLMKLVGLSNKIRVMVDWTLDLLIERSISQIASDSRPST